MSSEFTPGPRIRPRFLALLLPAIAGWLAPPAVAQSFPDRPIHIIVPYAAGGLTDALARVLGSQVAEAVRKPVIVENRPGASSIVGMETCAKAKPDGLTVCLTVADSLSYNPQLFANLPYDPDTGFAPVIRLAWTNNLLVANAKAPFDSYKAMIQYAKANPGKLNWATWGPATLPDLYLRWISARVGVVIQAIPYKGAAQANPAVYSGEADITYMGFGVAAPQIAVGVDPGLAGYFGLFAPGGTPKPIVERLNAEFAKAIDTAAVQAFYTASTLVAEANTPDQFASFAKADREAAANVFKSIGVTPQAAPQ